MKRSNTLLNTAAIVVTLIIICVIVLSRGGSDQPAPQSAVTDADLQAGLNYIQTLEAQDAETVQKSMLSYRREQMAALRDERLKMLEEDPDSVWSLFEDYLWLGDSRSQGFYYYGFLPESNVWAVSGGTILGLQPRIPDIIERAPSYIYFTYGMNDFCSGDWSSPEEYIPDLKATIQAIQEGLPDTQIYISSILPVTEIAYERGQLWDAIPGYNDAIRAMCDELDNCWYVDCEEVAQEHLDYWTDDGVHFDERFYPYWAAAMLTAVYDHQLQDEFQLTADGEDAA